jgi:hypothetical protein
MPDQSSSPQTDMSLLRHIDYPDSLIFLLNSTYLTEKQANANFIVDGFTRPVIKSRPNFPENLYCYSCFTLKPL